LCPTITPRSPPLFPFLPPPLLLPLSLPPAPPPPFPFPASPSPCVPSSTSGIPSVASLLRRSVASGYLAGIPSVASLLRSLRRFRLLASQAYSPAQLLPIYYQTGRHRHVLG